MGRGQLKARLTDQKMLLIGGAVVVGVVNALCLSTGYRFSLPLEV